ncbi:hypothetical protein BO94DRAFT_599309 [Aspergillus sclerotioniger CBS 115572]|uniref:Heterokaryon incompatibility domain-containing protein n=1 Tax=Aspergillus sclerotioniger CBS 115572 TaxID=1450535 RepID=A0A317WBN5_9EURO|nr:hypothetical protein BO94DRAFT_599309 [Aspergillus sclerotioniger CBS 115572]PWY83854.1 hypothetical protein BO94DRAFT_599309 [Aspergillus sclerotioniger CBS 115572]
MTFRYNTLNPEDYEIRLLCIHPSRNPKNPVQCSLKTVSLKKRPKFEALSYVWGTNHATDRILLEGNVFCVTPNLAKALYHLRTAWWKRMIWVDYICINQSDTEEKNTQVPLMGLIYARADRVVSWLGEATPEIELAVTRGERYLDRKMSTGALYWWWLSARGLFAARTTVEKQIAQTYAIKGVFQITMMPYWFRTWTYQEFLLAKHEPIFVCGHLAVKASTILKSLYIESRGNLERKALDDMNLPRGLYDSALQAITDLSEFPDFAPIYNVTRILDTLRPQIQNDVVSLLTHLHVTIQRQCENPKDRIYGLYGLCPGIRKVYSPDYNKTLEQIMLETTMWIMDNEDGVIVFALLPFPVHNTVRGSLPTWVPDYQGGFSQFFWAYAYIFLTHNEEETTYNEHHASYIEKDVLTLHLWAYRADIRKVVVQFGPDPCKTATQIMEVLGNTEDLWSEQWSPPMMQETLSNTFKIFYRRVNSYSTKEILEGVQRIAHTDHSVERERALNDLEDSTNSDVARLLELLDGNRLLIVSNTHGCAFGLSPGVGEAKDILVVPHESFHPLILRGDSIADGDNGQVYYKVVGQVIAGDRDRPTPFSDGVKQQPLEEFLVI